MKLALSGLSDRQSCFHKSTYSLRFDERRYMALRRRCPPLLSSKLEDARWLPDGAESFAAIPGVMPGCQYAKYQSIVGAF